MSPLPLHRSRPNFGTDSPPRVESESAIAYIGKERNIQYEITQTLPVVWRIARLGEMRNGAGGNSVKDQGMGENARLMGGVG
jgi:hypothetical protein